MFLPMYERVNAIIKASQAELASPLFRHCYIAIAIIPYSNPPVIIGGSDVKGVTTCNITLYDSSKNSRRKIDSLMHKQEIAHGILI